MNDAIACIDMQVKINENLMKRLDVQNNTLTALLLRLERCESEIFHLNARIVTLESLKRAAHVG